MASETLSISEVIDRRESQSKPDRGVVRVHTRVLNQNGVLVCEFKRSVLVPRRNAGQIAVGQRQPYNRNASPIIEWRRQDDPDQ